MFFRDHIAVGAPGDDSPGSVSLYDAKAFELKRVLGAVEPRQYDFFGQSLAAHKRHLFVGVPGASEVHQFDTAGTLQSVIIGPQRPPEFGSALAASKGRLAVVSRESPPMVRVYDTDDQAMIWARSLPTDCGGIGIVAKGRHIAIGVGCAPAGTRRVMVFDIRTGAEVVEIEPPESGTAKRFGSSVALLPGVIVAGAPEFAKGAAFAFEIPSGRLLQTYRPAEQNVSQWQYFGSAVAMLRQWVAVSDSYYHGIGAVHLFDKRRGAPVAFLPYRIDAGYYGHTLGFIRNHLLVGSQGDPLDGYVDVLKIRRQVTGGPHVGSP